ncbi:major capsid protein [Mycobacterium phage ShroomBoi]|nr:major capsid protein [Mycobacterium phage ShroomBoi]WRQ08511.1 major capsid protein [Mycobacterium phage mcgavigan]
MAFNNFIPELWSDMLLEEWTAQTVFANLVNRKYEGTASKGNVVHIAGVVAPTVKDYKAAGRQTSADAISDTGVDLLIDQEKSIDFLVDDIDRVQVAGSLEEYTRAGATALATDSDKFIADMLVDNGTALSGSAPTDADDAFDLIATALKELTKANVPNVGRVVVVNAEMAFWLRSSGSKLTSADTSGDAAGLRAGTIGNLLGARIVESNNLRDTDDEQFVAFHPSAAAYVSQIDTVEALRDQDSFSDRIRALHVYGGKVVRPTGVVVFNKTGS